MEKSDGVMNGEVVDADFTRLAVAFEETTQSMKDLRQEFSTYRSRVRWRTALGGVTLAVILTLMASMALVARSNAKVIDSINDCTQPGGECYEKAAKRTDERLGPFRTMICDATPPERRGIYCTR